MFYATRHVIMAEKGGVEPAPKTHCLIHMTTRCFCIILYCYYMCSQKTQYVCALTRMDIGCPCSATQSFTQHGQMSRSTASLLKWGGRATPAHGRCQRFGSLRNSEKVATNTLEFRGWRQIPAPSEKCSARCKTAAPPALTGLGSCTLK